MTESHGGMPQKHCAIGVLKFSQLKAGYPDVRRIAETWINDPHFAQVIVRKVSKDDYGIQFIYYNEELLLEGQTFSGWFLTTFINPHKELTYAHDVAFSSAESKEEALMLILKNQPL